MGVRVVLVREESGARAEDGVQSKVLTWWCAASQLRFANLFFLIIIYGELNHASDLSGTRNKHIFALFSGRDFKANLRVPTGYPAIAEFQC